MIKKLYILFKLGRKLAKSDALSIFTKFHNPPIGIKILFYLLSLSFSKKDNSFVNETEGERLSNSLQSMGTTFIKLGQFLATRPDIIGEKLSKQLESLQDRLPPFELSKAKEIIRKDLGEENFNSIINLSEPVAAASIAQVHKAQINDNGTIAGWPNVGSPGPQGPYYCSVGSGNVAKRIVAESHLDACMSAGLSIVGINAEVALGQWEYQIGGPTVSALAAADHLWISRYLLCKIGEMHDLGIEFDPKPINGDWNGSGMHINFSTKSMREEGGISKINEAINELSKDDSVKLARENYGAGLERRLTGDHETSDISKFTHGVADRSASVRIPWQVAMSNRGYFEDRRPNSNADPYNVLYAIIKSVSSVVATDTNANTDSDVTTNTESASDES